MSTESLQFVEVGSEGDLEEGAMRAVQVDGKRVLLTMVEGKPYAIGAICTHERANLDEGTLMGHEVYCPLHFSCFDVRTGEALAPPADRSTSVYAVKLEDGKVLVSATPVDPEMLDDEDEDGAEAAVASPPEGEPVPEPEPAAPEPASEEAPAPAPAPAERDPLPAVAVAAPTETNIHHKLIARIENIEWLESGSEWLGTALRPIREGRAGGRLFDLLHGRIMGHALHPALSDLPIGLGAGAILLDLAGEHDAAGIMGAGIVVSSVAAAATGVADWTVSDGRDRRVGLLHGILQTAGLGMQIGSLALRWNGARRPAELLLIGGFGVAAGSAYLGGHLVLGRGVMVDHTAWTTGPRRWTRALALDDVADGECKAAEVEGRMVLVSRMDGSISAIENACTHAGGPLSMGKVTNGIVTCPWHGSCFRLRDGAVIRGPAAHPQPMLEARVRRGFVEVRGRRR